MILSCVNLPIRSVKNVMASLYLVEFLLSFCKAALLGIHVHRNANSGRMVCLFVFTLLAQGVEELPTALRCEDIVVCSLQHHGITPSPSSIAWKTLQFVMGHCIYISCRNGK